MLLLIIIGSNRMLKAQDTAHVLLKSHNTVDVCESVSDRDYTISIDIGDVKPTDSLFGFDFFVRYNPTKVNVSGVGLTVNTLSQFFDNDNDTHIFRSSSDSGLIEGHYGTFSSYPAYGSNMPLIAFTGKFLGNCPDTSYFRLESLTFTLEFKKIMDVSGKYVVVKAEIADKPNRSITAGFVNDTVMFGEEDSIGIATAKINVTNNKQLENIEFEIVTNDSVDFRIEDVSSMSGKLLIDNKLKIANGYKIYTTALEDFGDDTIFAIKIKELKRTKNVKIGELILRPVKVNDCACVVDLNEGITYIKGNIEKDTTSTGYDEIENKSIIGYYNEKNDKIIIESEQEIKEVQIFDMLGNLIKKINFRGIDRIAEIEADGMNSGLYLLTVRNINSEIKKFVMIKN
ncbi:MAG: T9SS type A sorting domain-containing protein [Bacteroidetes bacterium]|nr:MAG: T9SS type A sorting domain-containing protein [Bacteroidota bacterium]